MAHRPKLILRRAERGVDLPATDQTPTGELNYLSDFLQYGTIEIGHMDRSAESLSLRKANGSTSHYAASPVKL